MASTNVHVFILLGNTVIAERGTQASVCGVYNLGAQIHPVHVPRMSHWAAEQAGPLAELSARAAGLWLRGKGCCVFQCQELTANICTCL